MSISLHGSESLRRKLDALGEVGKGKMLERALTSGALLVQNEAKRRVPRVTSNLARSIHIGGHDDLNTERGSVIDRTGSPVPSPEIGSTDAAVYVGTDVEYAASVEFGIGRAAKPYLRPAADTNRQAVQKEVGEALKDLIRAAI